MLRIGAAASITNAWRLGMVMGRPPRDPGTTTPCGSFGEGESTDRGDAVTAPADVVAAVIAAYNRHDLAGYERLHTPDGQRRIRRTARRDWARRVADHPGNPVRALPDLTITPVTVLTNDDHRHHRDAPDRHPHGRSRPR